MPDVNVGFSFPGEAVVVKLLELAETVIKSQPADVQAELWRFALEDIKQFRRDVMQLREFFGA